MKRIGMLCMLVAVMSIFISIPSVDASSNWYESTLTISDNSVVQGNHKNYSKQGMHRILFTMDSWNSNMCTSRNDSSRMIVDVVRSAINSTYASVLVNTSLYVCIDRKIGTQPPGEYYYKYWTRISGGGCGFRSNDFDYGIHPTRV